eukprot:gene18791-22448_t
MSGGDYGHMDNEEEVDLVSLDQRDQGVDRRPTWTRMRSAGQVTHHYTQAELQKMDAFESIDYFPQCSTVYKEWLKNGYPRRFGELDRWLMMGFIGFAIGSLGYCLYT